MLTPEEAFRPPSSDVYCVPALLSAAIYRLTGETFSIRTLAQELGLRVRPDGPNPWHLPIADVRNPSGITMRALDNLLPRWLLAQDINISYEHQELDKIPWGDAELYYRDLATARDVFIGVSLDWKILVEETGSSLHVVEIVRYRGLHAAVRDHSQRGAPELTFPISRFEKAMHSASGGFLILRKGRE